MYFIFYLIHLSFAYASAEPIAGHNVSPANFQEFPFIASLGLKPSATLPRRFHFCTGSLIAKKHVLTAAHCLQDRSYQEVNVIVGDLNLTTATIMYDVDSWITYDNWALRSNRINKFSTNDLAIVKLTTTVHRIGVEPVTITNLKAEQLYKRRAIIAGWGRTNGEKLTDVLLRAPVMTLTHKECEENVLFASNRPIPVSKNYLCTWADPYTTTGCGDSGGPLLDENNHLMGVIRSSCPDPAMVDLPTEYVNLYMVDFHTDISYYVDFLEDLAEIKIAGRSY